MIEVVKQQVSPLLIMRGIDKSFGGMKVLDQVELAILPQEVHALLGENGAGKSTLMKILSGVYQPSSGTIEFDGAPYRPNNPLEAQYKGISMIYQELNLAPHLSVEENIMLGREEKKLGIILKKSMRGRVTEALQLLGYSHLHLAKKLFELSPAEQQIVEIARALVGQARIIIMDEPTSSLSRQDAQRLFTVIGKLRRQGVSIIYISHFIEEVKQVADRYTVLRDGRTIQSGQIESTPTKEIIRQMIGRQLNEFYPRIEHQPNEVLLQLDAVTRRHLPQPAHLALHRGEILGIFGLIGAGRSKLFRAIFGLDAILSGRISIGGISDHGRPPWARLEQGVGLLSENRKEEGLALSMSITDNLTISHLSPCTHFGWIDRKKQSHFASDWIDRLAIRCVDPKQKTADLSGGNQQKVALARLLYHDVDILLLDEPTRGIDIGSKTEVYSIIGQLVAQGKAILLVSSYLPELLGICDRIAVMHKGKLGNAHPTIDCSEVTLLEEATCGTP